MVKFLQVLFFLSSTAAVALAAITTCNKDNCYNNLSRNGASAFCGSYTTQCVTATPTYILTTCGSSRLSSACSCLYPQTNTQATVTVTAAGPTVTTTVTQPGTPTTVYITTTVTTTGAGTTPTPTPTTKNHIANGDFESGTISPWFNGDIINESSYNYNTPQTPNDPANAHTGSYYAYITFVADGIYELDQYVTFPTKPSTLTLTFWAKSPGSCDIIAGAGIQGGTSYLQRQFYLTPTYAQYTVTFKTDGQQSRYAYVALEVQCSNANLPQVFLDSVSVV